MRSRKEKEREGGIASLFLLLPTENNDKNNDDDDYCDYYDESKPVRDFLFIRSDRE
jgi:hypothetical protein